MCASEAGMEPGGFWLPAPNCCWLCGAAPWGWVPNWWLCGFRCPAPNWFPGWAALLKINFNYQGKVQQQKTLYMSLLKDDVYSISSKAQTRMARLLWLIRTRFWVPIKEILLIVQEKNIHGYFMDFFLFYHENVCCVYSLELPLEAILMSTFNIPISYRRGKRHS